jgi:hypothetical protein
MSLPRFTAESSVYRSSHHYRGTWTSTHNECLVPADVSSNLRDTSVQQSFVHRPQLVTPQSSTVHPGGTGPFPDFGLAVGGSTSDACSTCCDNNLADCLKNPASWLDGGVTCVLTYVACTYDGQGCDNEGQPCCIVQCSGGCCDDDSVACCGGGCCYTSEAQGKTGGVCSNDTCCLPEYPVGCGGFCCDEGMTCCETGCCPAGTFCVDSNANNPICCTDPNMINCGGECCSPRSCINNGTDCCDNGIICGNNCCRYGEVCNQTTGECGFGPPCGDTFCDLDETCCNGLCCAGQCIDRSCCPTAQLCSTCLYERLKGRVCFQTCCPSGTFCSNNQCIPGCPDGEDVSTAPDGTETCCPLYQCDNPANDNICVAASCSGGTCCSPGQICCYTKGGFECVSNPEDCEQTQ